ncbi:MAG: PilN domain-containing protein [Gammaproteobacteria bacterium]
MTKINLLDWRAQRREQRKQRFIAMMGLAVAIAALIFGVTYLTMQNAIDLQNDRNEYLKQQIADVDQKIKEIQELEKVKNNLLARMRVIEELQASRSATVHFFDELVNTLPEGVTLTSIKQAGTLVTVEGAAESNGRVSTYMKNLEASAWFDDPKLVVIKTSENGSVRRSDFTLQVTNLTKATTGAAPTDDGEIVE